MWDTRTLTEVRSIKADSAITSLELSPDRKSILYTAGKGVYVLDTSSFSPLKQFNFSIDINSASMHPDGSKLVAGGSDFWVHVIDFESGKETELYKGHHGPVHCVRFSPDGEMYASGSEDGTIRLWQTRPGTSYGLWQAAADVKTSDAPANVPLAIAPEIGSV